MEKTAFLESESLSEKKKKQNTFVSGSRDKNKT